MSTGRDHNGVIASTLLLALRLVLGGLFVFAAYNKLFATRFSPDDFADAIRAFQLATDADQVKYATFILPWVELLAGVWLILGLWTRSAGLVIALLLAAFIAAITSVIFRGIPVTSCSCFGSYKLLCGNPAIAALKAEPAVGWCKVIENGGLMLMATALWSYGGGSLALDRLCGGCKRRPSRPKD